MSMIKIVNLSRWGLLNLANVESIRPEYDDSYDELIGYRVNYCHTRTEFMSVEDYEELKKAIANEVA